MVIAQQSWFKRRKYSGWGLTPANWRGWAYILGAIAVYFIIQALPFFDSDAKMWITILFAVIMIVDMIHVMIKLKKDERETLHEAKSERNALWIILVVLCVGVGYQVASSSIAHSIAVDPFVLVAIVAGLITKAISNYYYEHHE